MNSTPETAVFIHSSIKTRIETLMPIVPLSRQQAVFIHSSIKTRIETCKKRSFFQLKAKFLYIVPLKQGLKLPAGDPRPHPPAVFIHSSIKTRIETFQTNQ